MPRPKLTPEIAYNLAIALYNASGERLPHLESVIAQDAWAAFCYARNVLKESFPGAEPTIAQNTAWATAYASIILKTPEDRARFKEIQP
jgi:hypothetical protein